MPDARLAGNILRTNQAWQLGGNAGTAPSNNFIGTTDNQALELRVNGSRALRVSPDSPSPSLIGGYAGNSVIDSAGAVIAGGGLTNEPNQINGTGAAGNGSFAFIGGGLSNLVSERWGVIAGGWGNTSIGDAGAVGGGRNNLASGDYSTVGGGNLNRALGLNSTVAGGLSNTAIGAGATVSASRPIAHCANG